MGKILTRQMHTNNTTLDLLYFGFVILFAKMGIELKFSAVILNNFFDIMEIMFIFIIKASVPLSVYLKYEKRINEIAKKVYNKVVCKRKD